MIVYWSFASKANRFSDCLTLQMVYISSLRQPAAYLMLVFAIFKNNKILVINNNRPPTLVECSFGDGKKELKSHNFFNINYRTLCGRDQRKSVL